MKEIATMTPEERGQVSEFLRQLESAPVKRQVSDQEFEEISDRIFERHAELFRKLAL